MFTCISCRVAFETADEQRAHFATDWHRYNMKRLVANLPPVAAAAFNEKVLERREQNAVRIDPRDLFCSVCSKSFSTDNAFKTHGQSKKHRDREASQKNHAPRTSQLTATPSGETSHHTSSLGPEDEDSMPEDEEEGEIEERLAAARRKIQPSDCLFCQVSSKTVPANIAHMSKAHSFFIPDQEILVDTNGLLSYLGEKVVLGNLCLFCPNGGREFGDVEAVRRHMIDKSHCKIAYESDEDRAELADFYDFRTNGRDDDEWEDLSDDEMDERSISVEESGITLAPDGLSLLLPSGRTLGHRSLRVYYDQRLRPPTVDSKGDALSAKLKQLRANLADPSQALVPIAGGQGAFGRGLEVMKARNAGEAKWARKQGRSFMDQRIREAHRTRVGFVNNNQKHFRDPLLQ